MGGAMIAKPELVKLLEPLAKILERGNDAEIKRTKEGVVLLEVTKTKRGTV